MVYASQIVTLLLVVFWSTQAAFQLLSWLYWIQIKEYRFDRFAVLLRSKSGRADLAIYMIVLKFIFLLVSIYVKNLFPFFIILVIINIANFIKIRNFGLRRPNYTQRVKRIIVISVLPICFSVFGIFMFFLPVSYFVLAEIFLVLGPVVGVMVTKFFVTKAKNELREEVTRKLKSINPSVIAITGSYGKSTTKEFVYQLLSSTHPTLASHKNQNTFFGIGRVLEKDLEKKHKYFVAEMGAYKKGEIKEISDIVRPDISIITGIESQHLELFGNLENIKAAKFEIIEALQGGVAVINVSSKETRDLFERAKKLKNIKVLSYALSNTLEEGIDPGAIDMCGKIIGEKNDGLEIEVIYKNKLQKINTNITQVFLIENLIGAILTAQVSGIEWRSITEVSQKLILPERTSQIVRKGKSVIIDDSYNATPKGFMSALDLLGQFKGQKFVVTPGIIELGKESDIVHKRIAKHISDIGVKKVFITRKDTAKYYKKLGIDYKYAKTPFLAEIKGDYALLIEGRIPSSIYKSLL